MFLFLSSYYISVFSELSEAEVAKWFNILVDIRKRVLKSPDFKPDKVEAHADTMLSGIVNQNFLHNRWVKYTKELPIIVIETSNSIRSIGNVMGSVVTSWSCAHFSGAHAIVLDRLDPKLSAIPNRVGNTFFTALPEIFVNKNPCKTRAEVLEVYKKLCPNNHRYPWIQSKHPIGTFIPFFRDILQEPIRKQLLTFGKNITTTMILPQHQINTSHSKLAHMEDIPDLYISLAATEREQLPVYPDVTVHYRCSDNIFERAQMGLLPFHSIIDNIPSSAKYIFIVTEDLVHTAKMNGGSRSTDEISAVVRLCRPIIAALAHDIQKSFPSARVVTRRGGNNEFLFEIVSMFMYSSTVICSASTFCMYFAAANPLGKVFLPPLPVGFHGHSELNCCGNIVTLPHNMKPWISPGGNVSSIHVNSIIEILRNRSYHH